MKRTITDGETRARPAVAVCCVAIPVALSPQIPARRSRWQTDTGFGCIRSRGSKWARDAVFFVLVLCLPYPPFRERKGGGTGRNVPQAAPRETLARRSLSG